MILALVLVALVGIPVAQGIGTGAVMYHRQEKECVRQGKATRLKGIMLEVSCEGDDSE